MRIIYLSILTILLFFAFVFSFFLGGKTKGKVLGLTVEQAMNYQGQFVEVTGQIVDVKNNYLAVYIDFGVPHDQGSLRARIKKEYWVNYPKVPDQIYIKGQTVTVSGVVSRYQGDYLIEVTDPKQIKQYELR